MDAETPATDTGPLLEFLYRLGQAYLACGEQTALVELFLRRVASARRVPRSRVVALPTALFVSLPDGAREHVTLAEGPTQPLPLDQIADVSKLGEAAERGEVGPDDGLKRLNDILGQPPRFGPVGGVAGHVVLSVGLAVVVMPTATNLVTVATLGAVVGVLKVFNRN